MKTKAALVLALMTALALMIPANVVHAKNVNAVTEVKIQLISASEFKGSKGTAKIKIRAREQEFEVEAQVSKKLAGQVLGVTVNDTVAGTMTVNALGKAKLSLNNKAGQKVPTIQAGTLVGVIDGNGAVILAGQF